MLVSRQTGRMGQPVKVLVETPPAAVCGPYPPPASYGVCVDDVKASVGVFSCWPGHVGSASSPDSDSEPVPGAVVDQWKGPLESAGLSQAMALLGDHRLGSSGLIGPPTAHGTRRIVADQLLTGMFLGTIGPGRLAVAHETGVMRLDEHKRSADHDVGSTPRGGLEIAGILEELHAFRWQSTSPS